MAVVTPRKRVNFLDRHNVSTIDQDFLGVASYRDHRVTLGVYQEVYPASLQSRLSVLNGTFSDSEAYFPTTIGGVDQSLVMWDLIDDSEIPSYVQTAPSAGTVGPGQDFDITLTDGYFEIDDTILAADGSTQFMVMDKKGTVAGTGFTTYTFQWILDDPSRTLTLSDVLTVGKPLNLFSNAKGEFSADGRGIRTGRRSTLFQNTQIIRSGINASGSALSNALVNWIQVNGKFNNEQANVQGILPVSKKLLQTHIKRVDSALWLQQGNYDLINKKFLNSRSSGKYRDRPTFMGIRQQFDSSRNIYHYNPKANIVTIREDIKQIIRAARAYFGVEVDLLAFTGQGGEEILNRAMASENRDLGIQTHITLSEKARGNMGWMVDTGLIPKSLVTTAGSVRPMVMHNLFDRGMEFDKVTVAGVTEPERSFDIYFVPIIANTSDMDGGKANVRVHFKTNDVPGLGTFSRALVFGNQSGMTGLRTGSARIDSGLSETALWSGNNQIDSPVDGASTHLLTEATGIVTHPDCIFVYRALAA